MPLGADKPEPVTNTTGSPRRMILASCSSEDGAEPVDESPDGAELVDGTGAELFDETGGMSVGGGALSAVAAAAG